jgi:RanBP-type and C3HC4-type zinc finger-containing protein 1
MDYIQTFHYIEYVCMLQITAEQRLQELEKQHQHYLQLVDLDNTDLVPNMEPFECSVCIVQYEAGEGVVLRECLHVFCR